MKGIKYEHKDFISKCISTCTSAIRSESKTAQRNAGACGRTTLWHFLSLPVGKLDLHIACFFKRNVLVSPFFPPSDSFM
jgi:hypothetical protein